MGDEKEKILVVEVRNRVTVWKVLHETVRVIIAIVCVGVIFWYCSIGHR